MRRRDFKETVELFAIQLGMTVEQLDDDNATILFSGNGRQQRVFLQTLGFDFRDRQLVGVSSPAMMIVGTESFGVERCRELLSANAVLPHGAWAIQTHAGNRFLVMRDTLLLETLDPEEFEASVMTVASAADKFERQAGKDVY